MQSALAIKKEQYHTWTNLYGILHIIKLLRCVQIPEHLPHVHENICHQMTSHLNTIAW